MNQKMTAEQFRQMINSIIAEKTNHDEIAKLEIAREYFTNSDFRKHLEDATFSINT